jgi:hypothetical protein
MFDWFHTQNDNERNVWRPRVIFATLRHSARPILSEQGYRAFSVATFWIWAFGLFFVWVFKVEVSLSKDLITSIAGSSVELAALSLAVLGIIHELNEKDKWFKLGLLLVSVLFACVVFGGYFLVATWQPAFDTTQRITVIIVCAIGVVAVTQIEWRAVFKLFRVQWFLNFTLPLSFSAGARKFRLALPFLMPIFVLWFPSLNRLTAIVVLFSGALIALVALMGVTLILFLFAPKEKEMEDPFNAERTLKAQEIDKLMVEYRQVKSDWGHERRDASEKILNNLPHTMDAHFHLLPVFKFEEIISTLKQQL